MKQPSNLTKRAKDPLQSEPLLLLPRIVTCLKSFSAEEYFKISDLLGRLKRRYGTHFISRDTLFKILSVLEDETSKEYSVFDFRLERYIRREGRYLLLEEVQEAVDATKTNEDNSKDQLPGVIYYYRIFPDVSLAEIKLLTDAISSFTLLTMEQTHLLLKDLNRLGNDPQHRLITNVKDDGYPYKLNDRQRAADIIQSIDLVMQALRIQCCIAFDYYRYTVEFPSAESCRLSFQKRSSHQLHPAFFVWSNGHYYLVGKSIGRECGELIVFRVDRIRNMSLLSEIPSIEFNENPAKYRDENPVMYGGSKEEIVLYLHTKRLNNAVDAFGTNFFLYPCHADIPGSEDTGSWVELRFAANPKGVLLWAAQYCTECRILKPSWLADAVQARLCAGLSLYKTTAD